MALGLKTKDPERGPWVRIPPSPPMRVYPNWQQGAAYVAGFVPMSVRVRPPVLIKWGSGGDGGPHQAVNLNRIIPAQ